MPSLLLDTGTFLIYLQAPQTLERRAKERLLAVLPEQIFVSVVTLHSLHRMNQKGTVSDENLMLFLERMATSQILELDFETRLLADTLPGRLESRLIAATARRRRLTLLAATREYDDYNYNIDVVVSTRLPPAT